MFAYSNFAEAAEYFTKAIQCDSNFIEAWTNRGYAYELNGEKAKAHQDYTTAVNLDGTYSQALEGFERTR